MQVTQNIGQLQVRHLPRKRGHSNYTLRRLVRLFMRVFLNFSVIPLRLSTLLGIGMAGLGMLGLLSAVVEALHGRTPQGWASLMVVTLLLSGVQLIILGVLGEYLGRLFLTINDKPQFVIRDITSNDFVPRLAMHSDATEPLVRSNSLNKIGYELSDERIPARTTSIGFPAQPKKAQ
jgi:undecaprenyl-phosphate 4-deoxy-4-formamido-L-arabinose transferase